MVSRVREVEQVVLVLKMDICPLMKTTAFGPWS